MGAGVSGGADSVALLHLLNHLRERFDFELLVLHVNHRLRGAESDGDQEFVHSLAEKLDLPFAVEEAPISSGNLEESARQARREFFQRSRASHRLDRIALGHTRSDQAETVLHRLLRGAGLTGLAAMRFVTKDGIIRPLLTTSRGEVRAWAESEGLAWREDSSNADVRLTRNRLRQKTLPELTQDYNSNLEAVLAGTATLAQAEEDYWDEQVSKLYSDFTKRTRLGSIFQIADLAGLHLAVRRRLIRFALAHLRQQGLRGLDLQHVEAILALCGSTQGHDRVLVPGADALRSFDSLLLSRPGTLNAGPRHYQVELRAGEKQRLPFYAGQICFNRVKPEDRLYDSFKEARRSEIQQTELDWEALTGSGPLVARNWEPGDELDRGAQRSPEKVKTLFQEHRVRLWERRHWPVVVSGHEIVWVRGFGAAEKFRYSGGSSGAAYLTYQEDS